MCIYTGKEMCVYEHNVYTYVHIHIYKCISGNARVCTCMCGVRGGPYGI